jgi:beta-glucosidase
MTRVGTYFALLALALPGVISDTLTRIPDAAPPGYEEWESEIVLPAKNATGDGGWGSAVARARAFVSKLTLEEKINVTTGTDVYNRCVGNTGVSAPCCLPCPLLCLC